MGCLAVSSMKKLLRLLMFLLITGLPLTSHAESPRSVAIVIGKEAPQLERLAATELQQYLHKLFSIKAEVITSLPAGEDPALIVGTSDTNPAIGKLWGHGLPRLTDQGVWLQTIRRGREKAIIISGGSPRAVLWAVYELMERYGVRYLLHSDVLPENPGTFYLLNLHLTREPELRTRCWRLVNALAMGPESWGLEENKSVLNQLAKMKINRVHLSFWPWQSYNHFEFRGVKKTSGVSFFGSRFPIDSDMIGGRLFANAAVFDNPEFAQANSYEERYRAARRLAQGILLHAKSRGMETGMSIQPMEFPQEFASVLPGSQIPKQLGKLTIGPGPDVSIDSPVLIDLVATVIRSYVEDYPESDWLHLSMPEHRGWVGQAENAWEKLSKKYSLDTQVTFEDLLNQARRRTTYAAGERGESELKGDIATVYFLDRVLRERRILKREGKEDLRLVYTNVSEELYPFLPQLMPPRSELQVLVDYTASQVARQTDVLKRVPARMMPSHLTYTLADDNVGVLPQVATHSIHQLNQLLRKQGWQGFYTRYWMIGDLDPTLHFLARASWQSEVTPESAYRDLIGKVCGDLAVAPVSKALDLVEEVTDHLNQKEVSFAFPVPQMMVKHYRDAAPLSESLLRDRDKYHQALTALRQARVKSRAGGLVLLNYLVGRLEFATHYLDAVEWIRLAGAAQKGGQRDEAIRQMTKTLQAVEAALSSLERVAQDNSDRGTVAMLNEYVYRPVRDLLKTLKETP